LHSGRRPVRLRAHASAIKVETGCAVVCQVVDRHLVLSAV
jgi:hypothetical protein